MTPTPDFDRRLSDWLDDGPSSAPERSIAAALDHARVNPRRRATDSARDRASALEFPVQCSHSDSGWLAAPLPEADTYGLESSLRHRRPACPQVT